MTQLFAITLYSYNHQFADMLQCLTVWISCRAVINSVWWNDRYLIKNDDVLIIPPDFR